MFQSVDAAESFVESPDADSYVVFDSAGRKLKFLGKTEPRGRWIGTVSVGPVRLVAEEGAEPKPEELRSLLLRCLQASGEHEDILESRSTEELVDLARQRFGAL